MTYYLYISIFSIFKYNVRLLYSFIRCINYKVHFSTYIEMLLINLISNQILITFTSAHVKIHVYFNIIIYFLFFLFYILTFQNTIYKIIYFTLHFIKISKVFDFLKFFSLPLHTITIIYSLSSSFR